MKRCLIALIMCATLCGCREATVPKPRGYFRIDLPEHEYQTYSPKGFPYSFEYPAYSQVNIDTDKNCEPYWINIYFPRFDCKIHITYRDISADPDMAYEDSRRLVYKHTIKADAIGESIYDSPERKVYGSLYRIKGNAATPMQFALTDSVRNLFRGSLYFNTKPNNDSIAPVVEFLEEDIAHIIETLNWKN